MASVRCCSIVTSITVAIFGGCAKLHSSALHEPAVQNTTGKQKLFTAYFLYMSRYVHVAVQSYVLHVEAFNPSLKKLFWQFGLWITKE